MKRPLAVLILGSFYLLFTEGLQASEFSWLRQEDIDRLPKNENTFRLPEGRYRIAKDLLFPKDKQVAIDPGASFELGAGASLIFHGRLTALGTAKKPIVFLATDPKTKWGSLALSGPGANGSEIRYAIFRDGSKEGSYLGALSVFDAEAALSDLFFERNLSNAFHAKGAKADLRRCIFLDNLDDGIDLLGSSGTIEANTLVRCRTDALDIKSSRVSIQDNRILDSGGSGIELQERSEAELTNNLISGSRKEALKIVDESTASLSSNAIVHNRSAILLFVRKPADYRWSGQISGLDTTFFMGNLEDLRRDETARIGA